jgi:hypothetical protein
LDPRISLKDIDEECTNVVTARQRKEEMGRRLNKGDIEVLSEYVPEAVGSSVFDTAIHVPVDTTEMDGKSLGGNCVPIEEGDKPVVAAFWICASTRRTLVRTWTRR